MSCQPTKPAQAFSGLRRLARDGACSRAHDRVVILGVIILGSKLRRFLLYLLCGRLIDLVRRRLPHWLLYHRPYHGAWSHYRIVIFTIICLLSCLLLLCCWSCWRGPLETRCSCTRTHDWQVIIAVLVQVGLHYRLILIRNISLIEIRGLTWSHYGVVILWWS